MSNETGFDAIPTWAAVTASVLLILGGLLTVIGSLGLARMRNFYQRMHGPSMGSTLGLGCVLLASMLLSSVTRGHPVIHEILITLFMVTTAPITAMLLMRAAVRRPKDEAPPAPDNVN
jgi:multicomponent K+:H+ antiporter subunit G